MSRDEQIAEIREQISELRAEQSENIGELDALRTLNNPDNDGIIADRVAVDVDITQRIQVLETELTELASGSLSNTVDDDNSQFDDEIFENNEGNDDESPFQGLESESEKKKPKKKKRKTRTRTRKVVSSKNEYDKYIPNNKGRVAKYNYIGGQLDPVALQEIEAELGLSQEINSEVAMIRALNDPAGYLAEKLKHRHEIHNSAMTVFKDTLKEFKQLQYPDNEAIRMAKEAALDIRDRLSKVHTRKYPLKATQTAHRRAENKN